MKRLAVALIVVAASLGGCSNKDSKSEQSPMKLTRPAPKPPRYPAPHVEAADTALRTQAISQIKGSAVSKDVFVRAHAVEASKQLAPGEMTTLVREAAKDRAAAVRFAALTIIGEQRIGALKPEALAMVNDNNRIVQVSAIFALHRLGDKQYSHTLEKFAVDPDRQMRATTAQLLGMSQDPSASIILRRQLADADPTVRLQAAESLWRLRDADVLEFLVSATISRYPDDQMIATLALAEPRDPRVIEHVRGMLTTDYPEVNLVAARAMGMLGLDEGYGVALLGAKSEDARQRQLAAMAFGAIGRMDAQKTLAKLLTDKNEDVRVAAAAAILQLH